MKQFFSLLVVLMLFSVNAVAIETTPTGFYYPTGTSDPGPFAGWLSSGCNPGDPYFPGLYHIGHDYQTDLGAPVYLISDGIIADVSYGGWGETDGQTNVAIFVRHELSDGTFFLALYGHIQSSFTDEDVGVSVYAGNTLGVVGDWDYGIHLHFGVRPGTEIPLTNWGRMPCDSWPDTNGFVDPINWIENQIPAGSVPGSLVGYFIDGWNPDISPKFLDKYNDMATAGHPLGDPWDNGGSVFVHDLNDMWIQDFNGPDNGWDLPYTALIYYEDPWVNREAKLLKQGFWGFWMNQVEDIRVPGWEVLGVPITDEYLEGSKTRQRFRKFGSNHANDPSDWQRFFLEYDPNTEIITILDANGDPADLATLIVDAGTVPRSSSDSEHSRQTVFTDAETGGGGSSFVKDLVQSSEPLIINRTSEPNGVYHSGIEVASFGEPFNLIDGDSYQDFYAVINEAVIPIDDFTMDGDMVIYVDDPPPGADIQFSHWTIYPNPGTVGEQIHVEGEIWNAGGSPVTISELRLDFLDPNGQEVYGYSSYNVVLDPGWGWMQWIYCYPYMPGNHTARFRGLIDGQWQTYAIQTVYVQGIPPIADFTTTGSTLGYAPFTVHFRDQSANFPEDWDWQFGNGNTSTLENPSYTYTEAGTYTVSVTVSNGAGSDTEIKTDYIVVMDVCLPVADFVADVTSGNFPLTVQLTCLSSCDPYSRYWNLGDGTEVTDLETFSHTYMEPGVYTVELYVVNQHGDDTLIREDYITVEDSEPLEAIFLASPTSGIAPLAVQLTDHSTGNPISWYWVFGDGSTSTEQNPIHVYDTPGVYDVYLTVGNGEIFHEGFVLDYITVNPDNPCIEDYVVTPQWPNNVKVVGNYAYIASTISGLQIVDVSDPNAMSLVGGISSLYISYVVDVQGNYAYVADYSRGLRIINISDPVNPILVSTTDTPGECRGVAVSGNYAYVADGSLGLQVIDVSSPTVPYIVGSLDLLGYAHNAKVCNGLVYVLSQSAGLHIIDASNPLDPTLLRRVNTPGSAHDVVFSENYAYVADVSQGLQIVDISDPSIASIVGSLNDLTHAYTLDILGDIVYLTDREYGIHLLNVSSHSDPIVVGSIETGYIQDVFVAEDYVYAVTSTGFLSIQQDCGIALTADFVSDVTSGDSPLTVQLTDQSTGDPTSWEWDFGDDNTSTEQNPEHTYTEAGVYTITLTVSNGAGSDTEVKTDYITVENPVAVPEDGPAVFALHNNHPNPFNPTTLITYGVGDICHVKLGVYDLTGKLIVTLVDQVVQPGISQVVFNGSGLSSGVYFYKLETPAGVWTRKMTLVK